MSYAFCDRHAALWWSTGTCIASGTQPHSMRIRGGVSLGESTSLYVAGPRELSAYTAGAGTFTDDHLTLEFTAPRELHNPDAGKNGAALRALRGPVVLVAVSSSCRRSGRCR